MARTPLSARLVALPFKIPIVVLKAWLVLAAFLVVVLPYLMTLLTQYHRRREMKEWFKEVIRDIANT